ncbi:MAG: zinc-dependent peptidase, partial [Pedobacter sp.]
MNYTPYLILAAFLFVALYFIFRKKKVNPVLLSKADVLLLENNVEFYQNLNRENKVRFENKVAKFLSSIIIKGVGFEVEQLDKLLVASSAVIPIFGFDDWEYKNLQNVLLYPATFNSDFEYEGGDRNIMGMVGTGFLNGQMVLSLESLRHGFSTSAGKGNTGIHEFVHLLDKSDGATDGVPENFLKHEYAQPWLKMMHEEMERIADDKSDINPYATTNQAEFFAVTAEYFFEKPELMKDKHPALYAK